MINFGVEDGIWSQEKYLLDHDEFHNGELHKLLDSPLGRILLTEHDPLMFAFVYCRHHLKSDATGNQITMSEFHMDLCRRAKDWVSKNLAPKEARDVFICPRESGKSTWLFTILPLWLAAHSHNKFISAFADTGTQAEQHLSTFRRELDTNELLRLDYPQLCSPAYKQRPMRAESDTASLYKAESGFIFSARGADTSVLGLKIGVDRPDLLLLDDIEPGESSYSALQVKKRMTTLLDTIFPLNINARVVISGTVTMPGSIIHQIVVREPWVAEENIQVHHYRPILTDLDGSERSLWPARWSLEFLNSIKHTRSYKKNFENMPIGEDGGYWSPDDFIYGGLPYATGALISCDPAVTSKGGSDFTGLGVLRFRKGITDALTPDIEVVWAKAVRLSPKDLRLRILKLIDMFPEITAVLIEVNQGGDLWKDAFHQLGVKIITVHQKERKEVRWARALNEYQRGKVLHRSTLTDLEEQLCSIPGVPHDDLADMLSTAIIEIRKRARAKRSLLVGRKVYT